MLQADKPDSVVDYHLSVPTITCRDQSAYPSTLNEPFFSDKRRNVDLCGISACKVYPQIMLPLNAVSSYLTFSTSPQPSPQMEREKAVIFCGTVCCLTFIVKHPAVHRCIALRCPDFPTQLEAESIAWLAAKFCKELTAKIKKFMEPAVVILFDCRCLALLYVQ
jgi:hypothetical protein